MNEAARSARGQGRGQGRGTAPNAPNAGTWAARQRRPGARVAVGAPRATAKRPAAPRGSVAPDEEGVRLCRDGGTEGRGRGDREGRERARGREGGRRPAKSRGTGPLLREVASEPRARGDRLDGTASRPGARPPSPASPRHRGRRVSPQLPPGLPSAPSPRLAATPADAARSAPHTRPAGGSRHLRARARPSPAPKGQAHVTPLLQRRCGGGASRHVAAGRGQDGGLRARLGAGS